MLRQNEFATLERGIMKSKINTHSIMLTARVLVVAFAAALAIPAPAQDRTTAVPDTPLGKLAAAMIATFNTGDKEKIKSFITANVSQNFLKEQSPEGLASDVQALYRQTGGLDVIETIPSKEPNTIRFKLRSKRGNHWARFVTRLDKDQPDRLDGWGLRPILDPETEKAETWSEDKVTEADAVKEIERHATGAASRDQFSGVVLVAKGDRVVLHKAY